MTQRILRLISLTAALLVLISCGTTARCEEAEAAAAPYTLPQPSVLPEDRVLPATETWEPPVIDPDQVKGTEPWMLVIKVAQEELGYTEGPKKDQSKYGDWYAGKRVAWCAEFLTWCVNEADTRYGTSMLRDLYPMYGKAKEGAPWFVARGRFVTDDDRIPKTHEKQWLIGADHYLVNNEYIPFPGDYIWIAWYSPEVGTDHVAIVEGVTRDAEGEVQIHVLEGNNPDKVQRNVYPLSYKLIYGYGTPVRRAYTDVGLYDTCDDIYVLQSFLTRKGYLNARKQYRNSADRNIIHALNSYQRAMNLTPSNHMDLETRAVMEQDPDFLEAMREIYP
ncbi:MAG: CHAP domain-containing protein [Clostridia bacterium]|nr:CHAP domain-containing protein [Clostridia bacterium]